MPAVKYNYNVEEQVQDLPKRAKYKTAPNRDNNQQVRRVPKTTQEKVLAFDFALVCLGAVVAFVFIVIYSFVATSETRLANLHSEISNLNYENIDLENKLENVKSYYSVDTKVSSNASFEKAKNVIEVEQIDAKTVEHQEPKGSNLNTVTGF
ncbi:MAG: hypothetical protein K6A44_05705 [bacterium]|nr:hypothetical protein [bacterium]